MVTLISGLVGGLVATIIMTIFMMVLGDDSLPPTAMFWSKYIGTGDPNDYMLPGMILHLIYGTSAGGLFVVLIPLVGLLTVGTITSAVLWGLGYGFLLFIVGAVFWMNIVLEMSSDMKEVGMFLLLHLIYGAVLGGWTGYGILG